MFIIKNKQIQHFIASDENQLASVIAGSIRLANGGRVASYSDKELASMVKIGIERARSHGLNRAEDIAAFVAIMFEVAPRFDEQNEIREVLADTKLTPEMRLSLLFDRVPEGAWINAQKKYEDSFWFTTAAKG